MTQTTASSNDQLFSKGVTAFNAGEYFLAHEIWEEIWRSSVEPHRTFLQGLIQMAVALHHLRQGNAVGFHRLRERAIEKLTRYQPSFFQIDVAGLIAQLERISSDFSTNGWGTDLPPGTPRLVLA